MQRFAVGLRTRGETIVVRGDVRWVPGPSPWPWIVLALALVAAVVVLSRTRAARAAVGATLVVIALSKAAHVIGGWGTTVGVETKLAASGYAVGGIAVSILALVWLIRRGIDEAAPLVLVAGLFLALAGGLADVTVLARSQLQSTLPAGSARLTMSIALGLGLAGAGALRLSRAPRRNRGIPTRGSRA